jgi:hypothetical protein
MVSCAVENCTKNRENSNPRRTVFFIKIGF